MLLTVGLIGSGVVRLALIPTVESDRVVEHLTMSRGAPVESTRAGVQRLERAAAEIRSELASEGGDPVVHVLTSVGQQPFREWASGRAALRHS